MLERGRDEAVDDEQVCSFVATRPAQWSHREWPVQIRCPDDGGDAHSALAALLHECMLYEPAIEPEVEDHVDGLLELAVGGDVETEEAGR